jgi:hypothetical protein
MATTSLVSDHIKKIREKILQNLKQLDVKHHDRIYHEVLKKYRLKHTINSNGFFFNLEEINNDILMELNNYIKIIVDMESTNKHQMVNSMFLKQSPNHEPFVASIASTVENVDTNLTNNQYDECELVIKMNAPTIDINVVKSTIWMVEKEKLNNRKVSQNKFLVAKKKYSKHIVIDDRNLCHELEMDA